MIIDYTESDLMRGWVACRCQLAIPLEAGFDFPEESKVTCITCGANAIDMEEVENDGP